jgi:hypothetical protein
MVTDMGLLAAAIAVKGNLKSDSKGAGYNPTWDKVKRVKTT